MKAGPFRWSGAHCVAVGTSATSCTSYSVNSGFTINYSVITATISFTTSNITISYSTIITTNYIIIGVNNNTHTITDNSMHTTINVNNVGVNNIPDDTTIIGVNITDNSDSTNIGVNTSCNTSTNTIDSIDSTIDGNTNDSTICPDSCSSTQSSTTSTDGTVSTNSIDISEKGGEKLINLKFWQINYKFQFYKLWFNSTEVKWCRYTIFKIMKILIKQALSLKIKDP